MSIDSGPESEFRFADMDKETVKAGGLGEQADGTGQRRIQLRSKRSITN